MNVIETVKDYGIVPEEYNGVISLRQDRKYNGKWYWVKCRLVYGRNEELAERTTPVKIILGSKEHAKTVLNQLLRYLDGEDDEEF